MHATAAPSRAKPAPSSGATALAASAETARAAVQAKCACEAPAAPARDACTDCGGPPVEIQAALLPGHDFSRIRVNAAMPSDSLAGPGDSLEIEADRTAEQVLRRLAALPAAGPQAGPAAGAAAGPAVTPTPPAPAAAPLQRQADPEEDAADAMAEAALAGPEPEAAPPESAEAATGEMPDDGEPAPADEDSGEAIQAAAMPGVTAGALSSGAAGAVTPALRASIDRTRGAGQPLPPALRASLDTAFGADFSAVRIHADAHAASLAASVHARAFATGRDIYFGANRYDPGSDTGRRLLAHELTHVLQQGAAPAAAGGAVQRDQTPAPPAKPARKQIGAYYHFDAKGDTLSVTPVFQTEETNIPAGYFEVTMKLLAGTDGDYEVTIKKVGVFYATFTNPKAFKQLLARTDRIFLLVFGGTGSAKPDKPGQKPSADDPTGKAGPPTPPAEGKQGKEAEEGQEGKEVKKGQEEGKDEGKGNSGLGTDPNKGGGLPGKKKGSKYGVFGLLNLPQPLIDFMEGALDVMGESAEMEAMSETLRLLKDLATHRDALADLFKDGDTLLEIALGLKENAAISAIEEWVKRDPKPSKKAAGVKHKGIAKLAAKLVRTTAALRKVLKPVFKVRGAVQSAVGGVGLLLEAVPALESLLEMAKDPGKLSALDLQAAVDDFAVDFAAQLKLKLDFAPKALKEGIEKFSEADLVTYDEVAAAVTAAVLAMVPKQYKPIVKAGKALGIDSAISDNFVKDLIPKDALDGINGILRSLIGPVKPTLEAASDTVQKIIDELAPGFLAELPAAVRKVIKPSRHGRGPARRSSVRRIAGLVERSAGAPLDDDIRSAAEASMGHLFGGVRVHTDAAAAEASERLGANAFAIGSDVYFGPGRFDPASTSGRRLLYHELAHTTQQQAGGLALQPDYKDLLKRLAKRFSASVIAELRGATATAPAKQKQVDAIKDQVQKLIGRKVESRQSPPMPMGYTYIPKDKGKIQTIRRSVAFIRYVPALTIDAKTRRIKLAATLSKFDPKAPMRRALRAALGCTGKQEAHHIIPLELYFNAAVKTARANGFAFNGAANGLCISDKIHAGSHPKYTANVLSRLTPLSAKYGSDWSKLRKPFEALVDDLRNELKKRKSKLS